MKYFVFCLAIISTILLIFTISHEWDNINRIVFNNPKVEVDIQQKLELNIQKGVEEEGIKVGQIWIYEYGNPFEKHIREDLVLDIKEGWVKFINIKYKDKKNWEDYTSAYTIDMFKHDARLKMEKVVVE